MVNGSGRIRLYMAEEQEIFKAAYVSFFNSRPDVEVVGCSDNTSGDSLVRATTRLTPDVMLLGFKVLQTTSVEPLHHIRQLCPDIALVVLSAQYDLKAIKQLRDVFKGASVGWAYLLKDKVDTAEQVYRVMRSVAEGRVILDPAVIDRVIATEESTAVVLNELTPRELEVLSLVAKSCRNRTIAEVLCIEDKTVERHINNIYSKLDGCDESRHARVYAATLYLRVTKAATFEGWAGNPQVPHRVEITAKAVP